MSSSVVGLDIGTTSLRAVELSSGNRAKPVLVRFHEVPLHEGSVTRGEVVDAHVVTSALKTLWSEGGFKSKNVVLGMGNQRILARDLSVSKMSMDRIHESLPFLVQNMLQAPLADSLLDFYPISESSGDRGPMINGLLIAAEKKAIIENIRAVERAGLTPVEVDLIPFALNRLLINRPQVKGMIALIDVGASTTSILIAHDGVPQFVRIIPAGGDDLTQALKLGLEIGTDEAEELKRTLNYGASPSITEEFNTNASKCACAQCAAELKNSGDMHAGEILQAVTEDLLNGLRNTVKYFTNLRPQDPVGLILLTGGGARLSGFSAALSETTRIPVTLADPFDFISLPKKRKAKKSQPDQTSITVALGLALRNLS